MNENNIPPDLDKIDPYEQWIWKDPAIYESILRGINQVKNREFSSGPDFDFSKVSKVSFGRTLCLEDKNKGIN